MSTNEFIFFFCNCCFKIILSFCKCIFCICDCCIVLWCLLLSKSCLGILESLLCISYCFLLICECCIVVFSVIMLLEVFSFLLSDSVCNVRLYNFIASVGWICEVICCYVIGDVSAYCEAFDDCILRCCEICTPVELVLVVDL